MGRFHGMQGRGLNSCVDAQERTMNPVKERCARGRWGLTTLMDDGADRLLRCQFEREAAADTGRRDPGANIECGAVRSAVLSVG